jgi:hypothetical protein
LIFTLLMIPIRFAKHTPPRAAIRASIWAKGYPSLKATAYAQLPQPSGCIISMSLLSKVLIPNEEKSSFLSNS